MRKITLSILTAFLLLTFVPTQIKAATNTNMVTPMTTKSGESVEPNILLARLNEINSLDKSKLSAPEKKELRIETRSIKKSLKANNGGVYLSVGAIIIIVLLLILLL